MAAIAARTRAPAAERPTVALRGAVPFPAGRGALDVLPAPGDTVVDASGLWLLGGVVDCHTHLGWHAFDRDERDRAVGADVAAATATALEATLRAGVTSARDAGGLSREALTALGPVPAPRLQLSHRILDGADAGRGAGHLGRAVAEVARHGAAWVKVMATGGLATEPGHVLDPVFTRDELAEIGAAARAHDLRVMAHAWGGPAVGWLVAAGVASIEHGIDLTEADAALAEAAGVVLVPTVAIYRDAADDPALPAALRERAARAAERHPRAIAAARSAGLRIALGTDAGTPAQHGANLAELAALVDVGLSIEEAVHAATVVGAELLYGSDAPRGDAILLDVDPRLAPHRFHDGVALVLQGGRLVHVADRAAWRIAASTPSPGDPA